MHGGAQRNTWPYRRTRACRVLCVPCCVRAVLCVCRVLCACRGWGAHRGWATVPEPSATKALSVGTQPEMGCEGRRIERKEERRGGGLHTSRRRKKSLTSSGALGALVAPHHPFRGRLKNGRRGSQRLNAGREPQHQQKEEKKTLRNHRRRIRGGQRACAEGGQRIYERACAEGGQRIYERA